MACYHLIKAWRLAERGSSGKQLITFDASKGVSIGFSVPCGQCIGCRLERSRQWAMRCVHEASLYEDNCFITLTYSDEFLPWDGSLNMSHFQGFMKRLRARFSDRKIRFFHAGEYGAKYRRPHYHALLFNFDFADKRLYKRVNGMSLYTSEVLDSIWKLGYCSVGTLTFESAAYCARYIMKKVTGAGAQEHYVGCNVVTGELVQLSPEYTTMSRRPGIGREWFDRFVGDVFPGDDVFLRGRSMRPPRYYDCVYELENPEDFARIKAKRARSISRSDSTPERLRVREICKKAQLSGLPRRGDYDS